MNPADPLNQLRDIHLPDAIGWWPPAPGWWILAIAVLLGLAFTVRWLRLRHRANAYRRAAQHELDRVLASWEADSQSLNLIGEINAVLKRAAIAAYPGTEVANLSGTNWCQFLDQQVSHCQLDSFTGSALVNSLYTAQGPDQDAVIEVHALAQAWLKQHRRHP